MNTFKAEVNKIILALTSVGIVILLMFPASLSAHHYRYGTMSWEPVPLSDNGTHVTIRLKMQNGWTANHEHFRSSTDYSIANTAGVDWGSGLWVSGYIGSIKADYYEIVWGGGSPTATTMDHKILSRDNFTRGGTGDCAASGSNICVNSTISEVGDYTSSIWTTGMTHTYPKNGTTEYWPKIWRSGLGEKNIKLYQSKQNPRAHEKGQVVDLGADAAEDAFGLPCWR